LNDQRQSDPSDYEIVVSVPVFFVCLYFCLQCLNALDVIPLVLFLVKHVIFAHAVFFLGDDFEIRMASVYHSGISVYVQRVLCTSV